VWGSRSRGGQPQWSAPSIDRDSRVPPPESWPPDGISGTIGRGAHRGLPVLAVRDIEPDEPGEFVYRLWLPEPEMTTADGWQHLMYGVVDDAWTEDGTGALIDALTTELGVTWSTSPEEFVIAKQWHDHRMEQFPRSVPQENRLFRWLDGYDAKNTMEGKSPEQQRSTIGRRRVGGIIGTVIGSAALSFGVLVLFATPFEVIHLAVPAIALGYLANAVSVLTTARRLRIAFETEHGPETDGRPPIA